MSFPQIRMRRNRLNNWSRKLVEESKLSTNDLIWPIFITEENQITPIESMPGINRYPLTEVIDVVAEAAELGIPAIALFPEINSDLKDEKGSEALNKNNLICKATQYIKTKLVTLVLFVMLLLIHILVTVMMAYIKMVKF